MKKIRINPGLVVGIVSGLAYGLVARLLFGAQTTARNGNTALAVMSMAFVFLVPLVVGFLTIYPSAEAREREPSWGFALVAPWATALLTLGAALATRFEGMICIIMLLPAFLGMASVGGVLAMALRRAVDARRVRVRVVAFGSVLLLPYLAAPVERAAGPEREMRVVERTVRIHATPAQVWRNIERVPRIRPEEYRTSFVHRMGFPRPLEATLSHPGVGGVRKASFERGVVFTETVTMWQPDRTLSFTIRADPVPTTTLDEHVTVGGEFFDVLDGTYVIEPVDDGVVLHLASTHRLSTDFNPYAALWTDFVMRQIQDNILQVVKARSEARH